MVSDATGDTVIHLTRACLSQFEGLDVKEHLWILTRTERNVIEVIERVKEKGGVVVYTLVDDKLKKQLIEGCTRLNVPCYGGLDDLIHIFEDHFEIKGKKQPGSQYVVNDDYFDKVNAIDFTLHHDDGQNLDSIDESDVVLLGVSRTSKTPTSLFLAQHSLKTANVPLVPSLDVPEQIYDIKNASVVGLTISPDRLIELRKHRMAIGGWDHDTDYTSPDSIRDEILWARRLYAKHNWPVVDVTNRSIEETAAAVMKIIAKQSEIRMRQLT
jgi:[pyruvate, water dikinase]-phosphate phosphotransferase / [pyruvate, water dikinase] kinase